MTKEDQLLNRSDIIRIAREANFYDSEIGSNEDGFVHFAALVAAASASVEREACAMLVENFAIDMDDEWVCGKAAEAIRARGEDKMSTVSGLDIANNIEIEWRGFNQGYKQAIKDCVALLMTQHEAANGSHNYWHVAAQLIQADVASDT